MATVEDILREDQSLDDPTRADIFDAVMAAKDSKELAQNLAPFSLSNETRSQLLATKTSPVDDANDDVSKTVRALAKLREIDPNLLKRAETYKVAAKPLIDAALK